MEPGHMSYRLSILTFVILFQGQSMVDGLLSPDMEAKIDAFANTVLGCRDMVGLNIAVVQGNTTILTKGYGVRDLETKEPMTDQTLIGAASLSKAFAATLLAILLDESEKYSWDTPVRDILGDDFYFADATRSTMMTLRDLASHKTGIPSNNNLRIRGTTRQDLVKILRFLEPNSSFRTSYGYNNLMYGLLSLIAERIDDSGKSWEDLITERIYKPLGMEKSSFTNIADLTAPDVARSYMLDNDTWREVQAEFQKAWGMLGGTGAILTTAADMTKWLLFHLNKGQNERGEQVLAEAALKETHTPVSIIPPASDDYMWTRPEMPITHDQKRYALGWRTGTYRGLPLVTHTGTSWGYIALNTLLPSEGIGIYSSAIGYDPKYLGRKSLHLYTADLLMGVEPWINLTTACTFPEPWARPIPSRPRSPIDIDNERKMDFTPYLGTYGNFAYGNLSVLRKGSDLELHYGDLGVWQLQAKTGVEDGDFYGKPEPKIWARQLPKVIFGGSKDESDINQVVVYFTYAKKDQIKFERDLKMSDAGPPPSLDCPDANAGSKSVSQVATLLILAMMCIFKTI